MTDKPDSPSAASLERKLATILSADVAEYSRLMGEDEEQTLRTFRGHKKVFESLVAMHRGRIFNTAGDAILAEFASAVEAVRCATDIQAALRTRNDQLTPSRQVRFRIGVNLGDVIVQGQDLMGDGVNIAARLQTAAEPGGVCISGSVHDQIRNKLSLSFSSLGEMNFKNIQQSVRTFSITEAEGGGVLPSPKQSSAAGRWGKWMAALLLLFVAMGVYWWYTIHQRSAAETAGAMPAARGQSQATAQEIANPRAPGQGVAQPPQANEGAKPADVDAKSHAPTSAEHPPVSSVAKPAEAPRKGTPRAPAPSVGKAAIGAAAYDGVYSGPICFGKTPKEPSRCFHAEGALNGNKISGRWQIGQEKDLTMFLTGDISPSGDVKIEMHSEKADGSRVSTIKLTGRVHDGLLDASGSFLRGRAATLNWRKD